MISMHPNPKAGSEPGLTLEEAGVPLVVQGTSPSSLQYCISLLCPQCLLQCPPSGQERSGPVTSERGGPNLTR